MGDDALKQAKEQFGHLTIKEAGLLTLYRVWELEKREAERNGMVKTHDKRLWILTIAVAVIGALALGKDAIGLLKLFI